MKPEAIKKAVTLAAELEQFMIATADKDGHPHVATAGKMSLVPEQRVKVAAWFCPGTVANVQQNHRIALAVWDSATDTGYQLLGEVEKVTELAFLNGYAPEEEGGQIPPQVERELLVRVDKILTFTRAPHSDVED